MQLLLYVTMMLRLIALVVITLLWMLRALLEHLLCHLLALRQLQPMITMVHAI